MTKKRLKRKKQQSLRRSVPIVGLEKSYGRDLYHFLLTISWPRFLALAALFYLVMNILFALGYMAGGGITNARPGSFSDAFFFSVQTISTIGYGVMSPHTLYSNILVSSETLIGLLGFAMITGLMFAKFSRPMARVIFSQVAVIAPFDGVPALMFRVANQRRNQILAAQLHVALVRTEVTPEGLSMRRIRDLQLLRSQTPILEFSWTGIHKIDRTSPLYDTTQETLNDKNTETEIVITLTGIDGTFSQTIFARHLYQAQEIHWDMGFVDILKRGVDGQRFIDYTHFHEIIPLP